MNIITDPLLFDSIGSGVVKVNAVTNPAVLVQDLPPIDIILISHNHFDHMDIKSIKAIISQQQNAPKILVGLGIGALLRNEGIGNFLELDWGESYSTNKFTFYFLESAHTSRRGLFDTNKTLWGAYLIKDEIDSIYFAGDTAFGGHFKRVFEKYGAPTFSLLPIGAYKPRWFMKKEHMNPEEAVLAHLDLHSKKSMAIHFGMYDSAQEGIDEPGIDLNVSKKQHGITDVDFILPKMGQSILLK